MNTFYAHQLNAGQCISFYEISNNNDCLKLEKTRLHKPVIYLREFYPDEITHSYYDVLVKNLTSKHSGQFFHFYGKSGTGKTTFSRWILYGLHMNRAVIFLKPADFILPGLPSFLHAGLQEDPCKIIVFDAGDETGGNIKAIVQVLYSWVNQFKGVKIFFINNDTVFSRLGIDKKKEDFLVLPEFTYLPVDKVNGFFVRLGLSLEVERPMSHSEIFKTFSLENISWKNQQQ